VARQGCSPTISAEDLNRLLNGLGLQLAKEALWIEGESLEVAQRLYSFLIGAAGRTASRFMTAPEVCRE